MLLKNVTNSFTPKYKHPRLESWNSWVCQEACRHCRVQTKVCHGTEWKCRVPAAAESYSNHQTRWSTDQTSISASRLLYVTADRRRWRNNLHATFDSSWASWILLICTLQTHRGQRRLPSTGGHLVEGFKPSTLWSLENSLCHLSPTAQRETNEF